MARKSGTRAPVGAPSDWIKNEGKRVPAIFFRTEAGGEPVREWLKALPSPALLHGFIKKTRETPDEDLALARSNRNKHQRGLP